MSNQIAIVEILIGGRIAKQAMNVFQPIQQEAAAILASGTGTDTHCKPQSGPSLFT